MEKALEVALGQLGGAVDMMGGGEEFDGWTCVAADYLAVVLGLAGNMDAAGVVLAMHSENDDGGDAHGQIGAEVANQGKFGLSPVDGKAHTMAVQYAQTMVDSIRAAYR